MAVQVDSDGGLLRSDMMGERNAKPKSAASLAPFSLVPSIHISGGE